MQHYFASIDKNKVILTEGDKHHLLHVMRMKINDEIIVSFFKEDYLAKITCLSPLDIEVIKKLDTNNELDSKVTLFLPLLKGEKMDLVIQKATELGVSNIVLIKTGRCIVKLEQKDVSKKIERYTSIAKEASEQSRRQIIPSIVGVFDINKLPKEYLGDINLFAYEKDSGQYSSLENIKGHSISCLIGPEGGINEEEVNSLLSQGFASISLGKRILRAETAAINLLSVIQYNIEK